MAEQCDALQPILNSDETEGSSTEHSKDGRIKRRLSFASERNSRTAEEPSTTCRLLSLQSVSDDSNSYRLSSEIDERRRDSIKISLETNNGTDVKGVPLEEHSVPNTEEKENSSELSDIIQGTPLNSMSSLHSVNFRIFFSTSYIQGDSVFRKVN